MKYAVIDMGSNSVRLMLATVEGGKLGKVEKHLEVTRLGKGVNETKCLSEESMSDTIEALLKFKEMSRKENAVLLGAFATSAVRDAQNGEAFAKRAFEQTGVEINIISGNDEAELGFKGVVKGLDSSLADKRFVIIDIGGGSTELIVGEGAEVLYRRSFDVGVVRMTGKHITTDPVSAKEAAVMHEDIKAILKDGIESVRALKPAAAIGIGGTATTFGAIYLEMAVYDRERIHNAVVTVEDLKAEVKELERMTVAEKKHIKGLMPKRADVIYAGGVILEHILTELDLDTFIVSDFDNQEGILAVKGII